MCVCLSQKATVAAGKIYIESEPSVFLSLIKRPLSQDHHTIYNFDVSVCHKKVSSTKLSVERTKQDTKTDTKMLPTQ